MASSLAIVNKQGQALGRKGHETRLRLMEATRKLLRSNSPVDLNATSIAKKAKASPATFYIYFTGVRDVLLALCEEAEADLESVRDVLDEPWDPLSLDLTHASRVVHAFIAVWNRHREVLRYRNLEADRGDPAFENIRIRTSIRIVKRFGEHIFAAYDPEQGMTRQDAIAEASVLVAAMERLAAITPDVVGRGLGSETLWNGLTRIIGRTLSAPFNPATGVAMPVRPEALAARRAAAKTIPVTRHVAVRARRKS